MPEPQPLSDAELAEILDLDLELVDGLIPRIWATIDADRARIQAALKLCDQHETRGGWCKALAGVIREALEESKT
jgi:hypothetical protein